MLDAASSVHLALLYLSVVVHCHSGSYTAAACLPISGHEPLSIYGSNTPDSRLLVERVAERSMISWSCERNSSHGWRQAHPRLHYSLDRAGFIMIARRRVAMMVRRGQKWPLVSNMLSYLACQAFYQVPGLGKRPGRCLTTRLVFSESNIS